MRQGRPIIVWAGTRGLIVALLLWPCGMHGGKPVAADDVTPPGAERLAQAAAPDDLDAAMALYRRNLEEYQQARAAFEAQASAYWNAVAEKRRARNSKRRERQEIALEDYVLAQPPVYSGPPKPKDPSAPPEQPPPRKYVPVIADFLKAAAEQFGFAPQQPEDELAYKRAYAQLAAEAGLSKEQIVRVYAFEAGGNGRYDVQAGLEFGGPDAHAISTALGYNQLLHVNSVELMAEKGDQFVKALKKKAAPLNELPKMILNNKIAVVQAMIGFARTVPDSWTEHERLANTPNGLAIHAMVLDIDVGPLLQRQKLVDSVVFARRKGLARELTAAELEMMNLTGDGNGFDIVMMPEAMRDSVPTSNFFQRSGYERNPVAVRNNVVAKLIAATNTRMDREAKLQGARDMAAAYPQ